jgi:hypothetical protein
MIVAKAEVIAIAQENVIADTVVGMTNFVKLADYSLRLQLFDDTRISKKSKFNIIK